MRPIRALTIGTPCQGTSPLLRSMERRHTDIEQEEEHTGESCASVFSTNLSSTTTDGSRPMTCTTHLPRYGPCVATVQTAREQSQPHRNVTLPISPCRSSFSPNETKSQTTRDHRPASETHRARTEAGLAEIPPARPLPERSPRPGSCVAYRLCVCGVIRGYACELRPPVRAP